MDALTSGNDKLGTGPGHWTASGVFRKGFAIGKGGYEHCL